MSSRRSGRRSGGGRRSGRRSGGGRRSGRRSGGFRRSGRRSGGFRRSGRRSGGFRRSGYRGGFRRSGRKAFRRSGYSSGYHGGYRYRRYTNPSYYYYNASYPYYDAAYGLGYYPTAALYQDSLYYPYASAYTSPTTVIVQEDEDEERGALVTSQGCFDTDTDDPRLGSGAFYANTSCATLAQQPSATQPPAQPAQTSSPFAPAWYTVGLVVFILMIVALFALAMRK